MLIMELADGGNLHSYLVKCRDYNARPCTSTEEVYSSAVNFNDLVSICYQVALGMEHLTNKKVIIFFYFFAVKIEFLFSSSIKSSIIKSSLYSVLHRCVYERPNPTPRLSVRALLALNNPPPQKKHQKTHPLVFLYNAS